MNSQINTVVENALVLWLFRQRFPDNDLVVVIHCEDDEGRPEIVFLSRVPEVFAAYGRDGWSKQLNSLHSAYDYRKTVHGVRLVIRNAESVPAPTLEGTIRTFHTTDLCKTPN